jgi:hypothetical protein
MLVENGEVLATRPPSVKFIFNESAVSFVLFPQGSKLQHSSISGHGLQYSDEDGNAQAGLITNGHVEIRGHHKLQFSSDKVLNLWREVLKVTGSNYLASLPMQYQGRTLYSPPEAKRDLL